MNGTNILPLNLGIRGDRVENVLWRTINLPVPPSVKNVVILCGTNNIPIDTPCYIVDCIINIGSIFQKRSSSIDVYESWSGNRKLVDEVNEILKYQWNLNGFTFIFQDH